MTVRRPQTPPRRTLRFLFPVSLLTGVMGGVWSCSPAAKNDGVMSGDGDGIMVGDGDGDGDGDGGVVIGDGDFGGGGVIPGCTQDCLDFPEEPLIDPESIAEVTDADIAAFGSNKDDFTPGSLCVHEPQLGSGNAPGAMFPANWLRPRFSFSGDASMFEIRLSNPIQKHDLIAYTKSKSWKMPQEIWARVAANTHTPITVTIRGSGSNGLIGMQGTFEIAPVEADGTMVFWATNTKKVSKDGSYLLGFPIGSETVAPALDLTQVIQQTADAGVSDQRAITNYDGRTIRDETSNPNKPGHKPGEVQCIGCHTSTPDGDAVVFVDDWPWGKVAANVNPDEGAVGASPSYVSPAGTALLRMPFQGTPTMSPAYWSEGNRIMVTSLAERSDIYFDAGVTWSGANLVWINLQSDAAIEPTRGADPYNAAQMREAAILASEGTAWGYLALTGETYEAAVTPDWSHDGSRIAYTATNQPDNGHPSKSVATVPSDIHIVDYENGAGGQVIALNGASDSTAKEYYPSFSQDDKWIAFNRAESGSPYYNAGSEIYLVSAAGGAARRLAANDPPSCGGESSPGINNSWAKWSPRVVQAGGRSYYFIVFSSTRTHEGQFLMDDPWAPEAPAQRSAQLYMAAIVVDDTTGEVTDYPSVYLWNQNRVVIGDTLAPQPSSNLTPAWDTFKIPPPPVLK